MRGVLGTARARARNDDDAVPWIARAGLLAQGASFALVGVLALKLALGDGGKAADRESALKVLADDAWGRPLLIAIAVGFCAYALWRLLEAVVDRQREGNDASGLVKRLSQLGKAALYIGLTVSVVRLLLDSSGGGTSSSDEKKATGGVLEWPGGRWLIGAIALAVLAAAGWNVYRGVFRKYEKKLDTIEMESETRAVIGVFALIGLCARGVVFAIAGWFLLKAAIEYDPNDAVGIGGALAKLANAPYGPYMLGAVAAGLIGFALFCAAQARYREV